MKTDPRGESFHLKVPTGITTDKSEIKHKWLKRIFLKFKLIERSTK